MIPEGSLVVLTVKDITGDSKVQMADFKDIHALYWKSHVLGMDRSGQVRFGRKPLWMTDGVWYMAPDTTILDSHRDHLIPTDQLSLEIIP
jgi:hypothetical protein